MAQNEFLRRVMDECGDDRVANHPRSLEDL